MSNLVCPNKNTSFWRDLMEAVNNNEVDATEAWAENNYDFPTGDQLNEVRIRYKKARRLRQMNSDEVLAALKKEKSNLFRMNNNRLFLKKDASFGEAKKLVDNVNRMVKRPLLKLQKATTRYGSGGREIWYVSIEGRSVFKQIERPDVNYSLKAVEILQSDKAEQVFNKGEKNNWSLDKILTELQVPKEQKKIILDKDFMKFHTNDLSLRENLIMNLMSFNSFAVEINTAKTKGYGIINEEGDFENDGSNFKQPTQFYSNLTVSGGTNYTEQNFETPLIKVPKSHAQFNTENTIGFSRSDDKITYDNSDIEYLLKTMENSGVLKIKCN